MGFIPSPLWGGKESAHMPGKIRKITQGKNAKVAIYLGNTVRMFKKNEDRIHLSNADEMDHEVGIGYDVCRLVRGQEKGWL